MSEIAPSQYGLLRLCKASAKPLNQRNPVCARPRPTPKMTTRTRILTAAAGGLLPMFLYSYASGPDPRKTGAPGDQTCTQAGCHTGTALNGGGGSAVLT